MGALNDDVKKVFENVASAADMRSILMDPKIRRHMINCIYTLFDSELTNALLEDRRIFNFVVNFDRVIYSKGDDTPRSRQMLESICKVVGQELEEKGYDVTIRQNEQDEYIYKISF